MRLMRPLFHWRAPTRQFGSSSIAPLLQSARLQLLPSLLAKCDSCCFFLLFRCARPPSAAPSGASFGCYLFVPTCREPSSATCSCTVSWHRVLRKESVEPKGVTSLLSVSWVRWGVVRCHLGLEWGERGKGADLLREEAGQGDGGSVAWPLAEVQLFV